MSRRLITLFISVFALFFIVKLVHSTYFLWQKGEIITEREAKRDQLHKENQTLKSELQYMLSTEFIEREAREKLNLQREGEIVVVLPQEEVEKVIQPHAEIPVWKQWYGLFF